MTIKTSSFSGGGALPRLAPDLSFPSDITQGSYPIVTITGIDASAGLTTALSLTGKFSVSVIQFQNLPTDNVTFKLTVDGVVIWNSTPTLTVTAISLLGRATTFLDPIQCNASFLLEVQTTADPSIDLLYLARPVL